MLNDEKIAKWKANGSFAHIKREISSIPDVKFACVRRYNEKCAYFFIFKTEQLCDRFGNLLIGLNSEVKLPLTKCENHLSCDTGYGNATGEMTACLLF